MKKAADILQAEHIQIKNPPPKLSGLRLYLGFLDQRPSKSAWAMIFQLVTTAILAGIACYLNIYLK